MPIINCLNFGKEDSSHDAQIGLELLKSLSVGGDISLETKEILKSCNTREGICMEAIRRCDPATSAKRLFVTSHAYVSMGARYRKQSIEYLKKYIKIGACWEGTPSDTLDIHGFPYNQLTTNQASEYYLLGKAFEGEYMYDEALQAYKEAVNLHPSTPSYYVSIADVYRKKNDLKMAISVMDDASATKYYKKMDGFKMVIDNYYNKYEELERKGYIYKPRKKEPLP